MKNLAYQINEIVSRSVYLRELIADDKFSVSDFDEHIGREELDFWKYSSSGLYEEKFTTRLSFEGISEEQAIRYVGATNIISNGESPQWAKRLHQIVSELKDNLDRYVSLVDWDQMVDLFSEMLVPLVHATFATSPLKIQLDGFEGSAANDLFEDLKNVLRNILFQTLETEYSIFRNKQLTSLDVLILRSTTTKLPLTAKKFALDILSNALMEIFTRYPVLARLVGVKVCNWEQALSEFLNYLNVDKPELEKTFNRNEPLGRVKKLELGISDSHNNGRTVIVCQFSSGTSIVFKPKNLAIEAKFSHLVNWLNSFHAPVPLRPIIILEREMYGWTQFIEHSPCSGLDEAHEYFARCGALLCLAYLLEGTDCHLENIIASGGYPYLIDCETLTHPFLTAEEDRKQPNVASVSQERLWKSVLRTHMLPHWSADHDGKTINISGIFGAHDIEGSIDKNKELSNNIPFLRGGTVLSYESYAEDIIRGFKETYLFLLNNKQALLADEGPISQFRNCVVRFVMRPTLTYSKLLKLSLQPDLLTSGIRRSIAIDVLARAYLTASSQAKLWPLFLEEVESIERLDIPKFEAFSSGTDLKTSNDRIKDLFERSSLTRVMKNVEGLSKKDLEFQSELIRASFIAYSDSSETTRHRRRTELHLATDQDLDRTLCIKIIRDIAEYTSISSISGPDQALNWLTMHFLPVGEKYQLGHMGLDLYNGVAGIGVFFASLAQCFEETRYTNIALGSVGSLVNITESDLTRLINQHNLGGYSGIGSFIYALNSIGILIEESRLHLSALKLAHQVPLSKIKESRNLDVVSGVSGFMLALTRMAKSSSISNLSKENKTNLIELAEYCAHVIVERQEKTPSGFGAWKSDEGRFLTGFSHGAAGIAYALLELYRIVKKDELLDAALDAIKYESSMFNPDADNWIDLNDSSFEHNKYEYKVQWCHGAPGIGLARAATSDIIDRRSDVNAAIKTTLEYGFRAQDHLCCGNLGRAWILTEIGDLLNDKDLIKAAERNIMAIMMNATQNRNSYTLGWNLLMPSKNFGLMRGLTGLALCLLRVVFGGSSCVPNVLLLEHP